MKETDRQQSVYAERMNKPRRATTAQRTRLLLLGTVLLLLIAGIVWTLVSRHPISCTVNSETEILTAPVPTPEAFADRPLLSVSVLDVGQGDAILLKSPGGKVMLVDAGPEESYFALRRDLEAYGIHKLDIVIATHPHADHIGGMPMLLRNYEVGTFYLTTFPADTSVYEQMLFRLQRNGCAVRDTDDETVISWDPDVRIEVLNPLKGQVYEDANNASIVLRVRYGDVSFLLTGDMETRTEELLLRHYDMEQLHADVLKLGHHGSYTSTSEALLRAVAPRYAIGSMGKGNEYGHPHQAVLDRLSEHQITLYRTDREGVITAYTDGKNIIIVP